MIQAVQSIINLPRHRSDPMTKIQETIVLKALRDGNPKAMKVLVERNTRFIINVSWIYRGRGIPQEDLFQEGVRGLMRATETYDPDRGLRFMSYAVNWIKQSMQAVIRDKSLLVRLPANYRNKPTKDDSALVRARKIEQLEKLKLHVSPARLDVLADTFQLPHPGPLPGASLEFQSIRKRIRQSLGSLNQRERDVLRWRFGFHGGPPETLEQVAARLGGITKERVRQIQNHVLQRLSKQFKKEDASVFSMEGGDWT